MTIWEQKKLELIAKYNQRAKIVAKDCLKIAEWYAKSFNLNYSKERIVFWEKVITLLNKTL